MDENVTFKKRGRNRIGELPEGMLDLNDEPAPGAIGGSAVPTFAVTPRLDGRTLNRSGRTEAFALRVTPAFGQTVRQIAQEDGLKMVEVLEHAMALLVEQRDRSKIAARS